MPNISLSAAASPRPALHHNPRPEPVASKKVQIAVAMSGGVDSAVAAALLVEQGHRVVGIHMKLHHHVDVKTREKSCCSVDDSLDARQACAKLGIPFYTLDFSAAFQTTVIDNFVNSYQQGLTPNPCVMCNRHIKTQLLMQKALEIGCTELATGHYAGVHFSDQAQCWQLIRPADASKDQTYFLFHTPATELPYLRFPLADLSKSQVRAIARTHGFYTWNKPDSQQICFVPQDYRSFLSTQLPSTAIRAGNMIDVRGAIIGEHPGLPFFTIGQRKGLGLSTAEPRYVVGLLADSNQVVVGTERDLLRTWLVAEDVNWVSCQPPQDTMRVMVKVRYAHPAQPASLTALSQTRVRVDFDAPVKAIAPGQAAVFYDQQILLGGGSIAESGPLPYAHLNI